MKGSLNRKIINVLSVVLMAIPLLYIAYVILVKPTYIAAEPYFVDEYWFYWSINYWLDNVFLLSIFFSLFSVAALIWSIISKEKKMPWLIFQLFPPFLVIVTLIVGEYVRYIYPMPTF